MSPYVWGAGVFGALSTWFALPAINPVAALAFGLWTPVCVYTAERLIRRA